MILNIKKNLKLDKVRFSFENILLVKENIEVVFGGGSSGLMGQLADTVLEEEAKAGTKRLAIAAPGFSADCLETLEELAIQGEEQFTDAGGEHFAALACLNDGDAGLAMLETILKRELAGWI